MRDVRPCRQQLDSEAHHLLPPAREQAARSLQLHPCIEHPLSRSAESLSKPLLMEFLDQRPRRFRGLSRHPRFELAPLAMSRATGSRRALRTRKARKSRVERPAQWRSSITSSKGRWRATVEITVRSSSNRRACAPAPLSCRAAAARRWRAPAEAVRARCEPSSPAPELPPRRPHATASAAPPPAAHKEARPQEDA